MKFLRPFNASLSLSLYFTPSLSLSRVFVFTFYLDPLAEEEGRFASSPSKRIQTFGNLISSKVGEGIRVKSEVIPSLRGILVTKFERCSRTDAYSANEASPGLAGWMLRLVPPRFKACFPLASRCLT